MGIYQTICHKVEDVFVRILTKKQDSDAVQQKVKYYRSEKVKLRQQRKIEATK